MKINNVVNNISFKKALVAKCAVKTNQGSTVPCSIYKLSQKDDSEYFDTIPNKADWSEAKYLQFVEDDLKTLSLYPYFSIYSLENAKGDCLAYSEITQNSNDSYEILFLESLPSSQTSSKSSSKKPLYKYIGETFLSFLTKKSMIEQKSHLDVFSTRPTISFYTDKCFFKQSPQSQEIYSLNREDYNLLLKQNAEHTNSRIKFLG